MNEWAKPRTIFAMMFYALYVMLVANGLPIPDTLNGIINLLMGAFFGSKMAQKGEPK